MNLTNHSLSPHFQIYPLCFSHEKTPHENHSTCFVQYFVITVSPCFFNQSSGSSFGAQSSACWASQNNSQIKLHYTTQIVWLLLSLFWTVVHILTKQELWVQNYWSQNHNQDPFRDIINTIIWLLIDEWKLEFGWYTCINDVKGVDCIGKSGISSRSGISRILSFKRKIKKLPYI
jgi:hypothetical protein